jgi:NAD+ kinase
MKTSKIKHIGFVLKIGHSEAKDLAINLSEYLLKRGYTVHFSKESSSVAKSIKKYKVFVHSKTDLPAHVDLIVVLGGDGTFIGTSRLMVRKSVPVMGVNLGTLGFLTETKKEEALKALKRILEDQEMVIYERALLNVEVIRKGRQVYQGIVVNDAVISKGAIARIIGLNVSINGKYANTMRADGLIVSTPTGSTAYSLAAGGPIIEPSVEALIITPICPHSLTQRPVVVRDDSIIQIKLDDKPTNVLLTLDGQDMFPLSKADEVRIQRIKGRHLKLVGSLDRDYFGLIREKFKLGGGGGPDA